jgi:hypothetical protein
LHTKALPFQQLEIKVDKHSILNSFFPKEKEKKLVDRRFETTQERKIFGVWIARDLGPKSENSTNEIFSHAQSTNEKQFS